MGDEQTTLTFTVFWFGECNLGFLIHEAKRIGPTSNLYSVSIACS